LCQVQKKLKAMERGYQGVVALGVFEVRTTAAAAQIWDGLQRGGSTAPAFALQSLQRNNKAPRPSR
jgi:hypothetical protein